VFRCFGGEAVDRYYRNNGCYGYYRHTETPFYRNTVLPNGSLGIAEAQEEGHLRSYAGSDPVSGFH